MKLWSDKVRTVIPYTPGEQPKVADIIKLNTNENPYPPAPGVLAVKENMDVDAFRKYPDPTCSALVDVLADYYGVGRDQVFVGVGSDDVLSVAFLTFFNSDKPILFPDITYSFYPVWADVYRIPYEVQPLDENFEIVAADYYKENGGIVIANPNAPTGCAVGLDFIEDLLKHNLDVIVIVDEAYVDFGAESAIKLVDKYDNLLVVQTFSKSRSMAGMRIGYAIGQPELIKYMNDVKYSINSYTMNMPSLSMGVAAVEDDAYFKTCTEKIIKTREFTKEQLTRLGFVFPDSKTNFIFAKHPNYCAKTLFEALKEVKIYVRYFNQPRINEYLRISIGTDEEMEKLIGFLENYMK